MPRVSSRVNDHHADDGLTACFWKEAETDIAFGQVNGDQVLVRICELNLKVFVGRTVVCASADQWQNNAPVVFAQLLVADGLAHRVFIPLNGVAAGDIEVGEFKRCMTRCTIGIPGEPSAQFNGVGRRPGAKEGTDGPFMCEGAKGHWFVGNDLVVHEHQPP